jgi:hypothetical protein
MTFTGFSSGLEPSVGKLLDHLRQILPAQKEQAGVVVLGIDDQALLL